MKWYEIARSGAALGIVCGVLLGLAVAPVQAGKDDRQDRYDRQDQDDGDDGRDRKKAAKASAEIVDCTSGEFLGVALLKETRSEEGVKNVRISMRVKGLPEGKHAVHLHETAQCVPCGAAGGHFDPGPAGFTSPDGNHPYHSGDLVNIDINRKGTGSLHTSTTRISLSPGPLSLFDDDGSAFIIHVNADTYCPDGEVTGCAGGGRAACGIIVPD